jgi:hypothetical protein
MLWGSRCSTASDDAVGDAVTAIMATAQGVWVPNWSSTSRDLRVFVYQPAEQITTSEVNLGWRCRRW